MKLLLDVPQLTTQERAPPRANMAFDGEGSKVHFSVAAFKCLFKEDTHFGK